VCGFDLKKPAVDFTICPSCGVEFGYADVGRSYNFLRNEWIEYGAMWTSTVVSPPKGWNAWFQLILAGFPYSLPYKISIQEVANKPNQTELRI
jgi:hypothetical protein